MLHTTRTHHSVGSIFSRGMPRFALLTPSRSCAAPDVWSHMRHWSGIHLHNPAWRPPPRSVSPLRAPLPSGPSMPSGCFEPQPNSCRLENTSVRRALRASDELEVGNANAAFPFK
jgi:hypothetical protein